MRFTLHSGNCVLHRVRCMLFEGMAPTSLSYGCFNVAHWLFASEYYKIAKIMPYALEELPVPDEIKTKHKCVNGLMLFLNIIFPIASGPIGYFTDKADINNNGRDPKDDM